MKHFFIIIFSVFLLGINVLPAVAQKDKKTKMELLGDKHYEVGDYYLAAEYYQQELERNPDNLYASYQIARCYRKFFEYNEARKWYQKVVEEDKEREFPLARYYYAHMLKMNGEYVPASEAFETFMAEYTAEDEEDEYIELALLHYNGCILALSELKKPQRNYGFQNPGPPVNTPFSDYGAVMYEHDTSIVVTSSRMYDEKEQVYKVLGGAYSDNYFLEKDTTEWTILNEEDEKKFKNLNTKYNDGAGVFNKARDKYYFTSCGEFSDDKREINCAIFVSKLKEDVWGKPEKLNEHINPKGEWNAQPSLTDSGDTLFFVSKRPGGLGQHDIWYSVQESDSLEDDWGEAVNLGEPVNTPLSDFTPSYYSKEQALFFSSDGHEGFGGFDIFIAKGDSLEDIRNIGLPFNSNMDDFYFVLGDKVGYLSSNRSGGEGNDDVYSFNIMSREAVIAEIESDSFPNAHSITIRGKIVDHEQQPVEGVVVLLTDSAGNTLKTTMTDEEGKFVFANLDPDRDYRVMLEEDDGSLMADVEYHAEDVSVVENEEPLNTSDLETAHTTASRVLFEHIYFDFDKDILRPEAKKVLDELAEYIKDHPSVKVEIQGHTDAVGSSDYNEQLGKRRGDAAFNYLVKKGVKRSTIVVNSAGEAKPIASNEHDVGRQLNRRVEFYIVGGGAYESEAMAYVIEPRTTLDEVAQRFDMTVEELKEMNNLQGDDVEAYTPLRVRRHGDEVISSSSLSQSKKKSPSREPSAGATSSTPSKEEASYITFEDTDYNKGVKYMKWDGEPYYTILPKNTLYSISRICETTVEKLKELNGFSDNYVIYPGQRIKVRPTSEPDKKTDYEIRSALADAGVSVQEQKGQVVMIGGKPRYVVKEGDTLYSVAKRFDMTIDALKKRNGLKNSQLRPGMTLKVDKE